MKKVLVLSLLVATAGLTACGGSKSGSGESAKLESNLEQASYAMGRQTVERLHSQNKHLDPAAFVKGVEDALAGEDSALTEEQMNVALDTYYKERRAKLEEERKARQAMAKGESEKFLKDNAGKEGVKVTESGLQYKLVQASGSDVKPGLEDRVVVNYRGRLLNGVEFDSSYKRGRPATFPLKNVIDGWQEGLQLMSKGDKYELYIPSELAYGPAGSGRKIPPYSALIFEVELVDVLPAEVKAQPAAQTPAKSE